MQALRIRDNSSPVVLKPEGTSERPGRLLTQRLLPGSADYDPACLGWDLTHPSTEGVMMLCLGGHFGNCYF